MRRTEKEQQNAGVLAHWLRRLHSAEEILESDHAYLGSGRFSFCRTEGGRCAWRADSRGSAGPEGSITLVPVTGGQRLQRGGQLCSVQPFGEILDSIISPWKPLSRHGQSPSTGLSLQLAAATSWTLCNVGLEIQVQLPPDTKKL
ncbi:hypothetical protein mRhiFer1_008238 [Rhinolophus ferrumequinum]|uniref:Uncharacterized protein n=1 Tax=Rhinolophus ferrumequinum TaxID=59479 RepID=A0A7J7VQL2_RHIFE|nr:hypothetical protein mRhiFer1_008238 [Rhinolophus ferrumequinum]